MAHVPGRVSPGNQAWRYGDRTASGTAGGRKGAPVETITGETPGVSVVEVGVSAV
jgi:hypothetical protein